MSQMKNLLYIILLAVLISSCGQSKKITSNEKPILEPCEPITFTDDQFRDIESDYYSLDSLFIDNNCLNIWVSYGGGCGDSEFTLLYNNKVMKSMPPKTNLMLKFTDNDNCRAIVQQKLYYDLSFFDDYAKSGGINLRLVGLDSSVLYKK